VKGLKALMQVQAALETQSDRTKAMAALLVLVVVHCCSLLCVLYFDSGRTYFDTNIVFP